jgi:murein DD-endopeptidase MepM/ murein hydrolase activator NlpD
MRFVAGTIAATMLAGQAAAALQVSHRARALAPGEAVLVVVRSREALAEVEADWMGQRVPFFLAANGAWRGIAAIDVGARPGRQTLQVRARTVDGAARTRAYPLTIARRTFPVRRLTVDDKYAEPPPEVISRIQREQRTVEAIFARTPAEPAWTEPFAAPVPGSATSSFGRRSIVNGEPRSPHSGTDFQAAGGTRVRAPNRGTVVLTGDHYFAGRIVIIDHGGNLYSYLAHLSRIDVSEGDVVERGQTIGLSGASGTVTGPHLHWTLRVGGARIDPLSLIFVTR